MHIRVLGPLEVTADDRSVALGGSKQRAILAMLGLEANTPVTAERLIDGLWGEVPPASAPKMVQTYVWRLRGVLAQAGGAEIVTRGRAYELRIDPELVDVHRLERLVLAAARAAETSEASDAAREALALFRGDPLADVADEPFATPVIHRLEELRLTASELAIDADLAAGRHREIVVEVDALLAANPLRERLHAQRMLGLYRCGRQAEALEAYRDARTTLVEEIGVEPRPELRRLHDAILRQDPALDLEPAAAQVPAELDASAAPPLIGRDSELRRLRAHWQRAAAGAGTLVTLVGASGMGKTRVAAEIAGHAHREGAAVLYTSGAGPPEAVLALIARARAMRSPVYVVIDDADRAPADVRAALRDLGPAIAHAPVLVLAAGQAAAGLARLEPSDTVVLEGLDADGVRAIARFYAPGGDAEAIPVDALLATSHGVPRRVHEAAGEWARREATRRIDTAAARAAAGRSQAQALESELAGGVVALQATRERVDRYARDRADAPVICPYKGLATYQAHDAEYFFGRERLVAELAARLVGAPLLAVVGPSGSGKSSVVAAGLLPALADGVLPGSEQRTQALIRPGEQPLRTIQRATHRLARERCGVLVVDQFEELFTACHDEEQRRAFVAALVRTAGDRDARILVVLAVRADFYGRCAAYPELSRLLGANHVLVGPMSREELARAIERPAERAGLSVEPELVEALLSDVEAQPGALPLLSTALLELWRERDGRRLRLATYARSGGVQGAVARLAEDAFVRLDPAQQAAARTLLLRLADDGEEGAVVRRRVALTELESRPGDAIAEVVAQLTDRRLLTVSDGAVEVAHEALLREWPRLRTWLDDDVQGRRLHRQLGAAARAWSADARDPGGLLRGARLAAALDWAADHDRELTSTERAFLDSSRSAGGRAQRRLRIGLGVVASLLVLAVVSGLVALEQRGNARAEATTAAAQRLGAQALADDDVDRALLFARQGVALDDSLQTRSNLLATLLKYPAVLHVVRGDGLRLAGLALSPDGRTVALVDERGSLRFLDARTRRAVGRPQIVPGSSSVGTAVPVVFSDDGAVLAVGGEHPLLLDAVTHRALAGLTLGGGEYAEGLRFEPDGRALVAFLFNGFSTESTSLQRFDVHSGRRLGAEQRITRASTGLALVPSRDGRRLVTSVENGPTVIRDPRTLRPLTSLAVGAGRAALSPDDRTLLLGGRDGSVRFLDLVTGKVRTASGRHSGAVVQVTVSADGHTAVTAGEDARLIVWDIDRAAAAETLQGHAGQITGMAIAHDGRTLYTAANDGKLLIWDLAGDRRLSRPFRIGTDDRLGIQDFAPRRYALSPDGSTLAVGHPDGTITLIDALSLRTLASLRAVEVGPVRGVEYVPGGAMLVVAGDTGLLTLVDTRARKVVMAFPGQNGPMFKPSFSADGRLMASLSAGDTVSLWRLRSGRPLGPPRLYYHPTPVIRVALSPDGRLLAMTSPDAISIIDVGTLRRRKTLTMAGPTTTTLAEFTSDGRFVITGNLAGQAQLWSTRTWRPATGSLAANTGTVSSASLSPDGRTLATGSTDGTIRLLDLPTERPLGAPLSVLPNSPVGAQFSPDGAYLFGITDAGRAARWDVRPASWARQACAVAGRTLTRAEWGDALPGRPYAPACR